MPSTITTLTDISPVTQTTLADAIKTAFASTLGYTALDDYTASNIRNLVFQKAGTSGKTYDSVVFRIATNQSLGITQDFGTAFNTSTKVLTNPGNTGVGVTFSNASGIQVRTFRSQSSEFDLLVLAQGLNSHVLGWIKPSNLNSVDENIYNVYHHFSSFSARTLVSCANAISLFGISIKNTPQATITIPNHNNRNDLLSKLVLLSSGGILGSTSDDFAFGAGNGLAIFGQVGDYYKIWDGATSSSSLFLK